MQVNVRGKNIQVTDALRAYVEKRLGKLEKYFNHLGEAQVMLSVEKGSHRIEVTVPLNGLILRGEEASHDMYASVDLVVEKLEKQLEKYKGRLFKRFRGEAAAEAGSRAEREGPQVVKVKRFPVKPMHVEEAILQMNLLGHAFFMFANAETGEMNVVYKRKDGNYGLIAPEV